MAGGEEGVCLNHISRESNDINRLAKFYQEVTTHHITTCLESLRLYGYVFHLLPYIFTSSNNLPEGPWSATSPVKDPSHHLCFSVSTLKDKGIETFEKSLPNGKIKQVFFFDPDGNGLEVASKEHS